jgi:hypothetical protein
MTPFDGDQHLFDRRFAEIIDANTTDAIDFDLGPMRAVVITLAGSVTFWVVVGVIVWVVL